MKIKIKVSLIILLILRTYGYSSPDNSGTGGTHTNLPPQHIEIQEPITGTGSLSDPVGSESVYEIPPIRTSNSHVALSKLEGLFIEKFKTGENNHLKLMLVFSEEPENGPAVFLEKNPYLNLWTVDIYNSHLGGTITELIEENPVTNSAFEEFTLDLNQDVNGMQPDVRNVLRFKVATEMEVDCQVEKDDFNKVIIDLSWNDQKELMESPEETGWISKLSFWK